VTRQTVKRLAVRYVILQDEIEKQLDSLVRAVKPPRETGLLLEECRHISSSKPARCRFELIAVDLFS